MCIRDRGVFGGLLPFAAENDIGIINGSPIVMGLLSGLEPDVSVERMHLGTSDAEKAHRLWQWANGNNLNVLNLAIQFCFRQPRIAMSLTGSKNTTEVEQNFAAATTPVPDDVWEQLEALS